MISVLLPSSLFFLVITTASSLLLPNLTTTLTSPANPSFPEWRCYPTNAPFPLVKVKLADCRQLVRDIANLDRAFHGQKWVFGTADAPGVERVIPQIFSRKTCVANVIDTESGEAAYDSFTLRYLSQKIARMTDLCVAPSPQLGGEGLIGGKGVLAVTVTGIAEPDDAALGRVWRGFVVRHGRNSSTRGTEIL